MEAIQLSNRKIINLSVLFGIDFFNLLFISFIIHKEVYV